MNAHKETPAGSKGDEPAGACEVSLAGDNQSIAANPTNLQNHHRQLCHEHGLSDETIAAAGIYTETNAHKIRSLLNCPHRKAKNLGACLVFPFVDLDGRSNYAQVRPDVAPLDKNKRKIKYLSPAGQDSALYIPPGVREVLDDPKRELLITEGCFKALAATQNGFPCVAIAGVWNWRKKSQSAILPSMERIQWKGRSAIPVFDSDIAQKPSVQLAETWLAHYLRTHGAKVRVARLPDGPPDAAGQPSKVGIDDYIVANGADAKRLVRELLDRAEEPSEPEGGIELPDGNDIDPAEEAKAFLANAVLDDSCRLRFWRGSFWYWSRGRYVEMQTSEVRAGLIVHLNKNYRMVRMKHTSDVFDQVKAQSLLPFGFSPPCWLGNSPDWSACDVVVFRNGVVHLPSAVASDQRECLLPATPRLFTQTALDFDFDPEAPAPKCWFEFLRQLWGDDSESIELLQEWFGYSLTPDTRQHKILLLIGPQRSGKGTIARILRAIVGEPNVAGPSLSSLQTTFGLWPLLDKSLAIIADARLGGRSDQAAIVERLLAVSGEDAQTIDRKGLEPVTTKLNTRFVMLSNELPRLSDSSGALASRFLVLRFMQSFLGREDRELTDKLMAERASILLWAIEGWRRLRSRGRFLQPGSGRGLCEQMEDLASPISVFIRQRCAVGPEYGVPADDLFRAWQAWCAANGKKDTGTSQTFGRDLRAALPQLDIGQRRGGDGARYRSYAGIGLSDAKIGLAA